MSSLKQRSAARIKGNGSKAAARQERRGARGKDHEPFRRFVADIEARESQRRPTRARQERIAPLTPAQARLDAAMASHTITFVTGPAGTGKTYLPAARAAEAIRDGLAQRIIVTRPTIEAGAASLGFLPGELEEKMAPYFRPVREAFEDVLGSGHVEMLMSNGTIEARPVQFLRGSTFKDAIVLVDEAQNLTPAEMELILTRIGEGTKVIVDGDLRQRDTQGKSGLSDAIERLRDHPAITHVSFSIDDVVRSDIVGDIIRAYAS